jgi:hypothetical protein
MPSGDRQPDLRNFVEVIEAEGGDAQSRGHAARAFVGAPRRDVTRSRRCLGKARVGTPMRDEGKGDARRDNAAREWRRWQ